MVVRIARANQGRAASLDEMYDPVPSQDEQDPIISRLAMHVDLLDKHSRPVPRIRIGQLSYATLLGNKVQSPQRTVVNGEEAYLCTFDDLVCHVTSCASVHDDVGNSCRRDVQTEIWIGGLREDGGEGGSGSKDAVDPC